MRVSPEERGGYGGGFGREEVLLLLLYLITLMEPEAMKRQLTYMVRLPHLVPDSVSFMIVATFEWTPVINANDPLTKEIPLSA